MAITNKSSPAIATKTCSQSLLHAGPGPAIAVELNDILKRPATAQDPHGDNQKEDGRMFRHVPPDLMIPVLEVDDRRGKVPSPPKHRWTMPINEIHRNDKVLEETGMGHIIASHLDPDEQAMLPKLDVVPWSPRRGNYMGSSLTGRGKNGDSSSRRIGAGRPTYPYFQVEPWYDSALSLSSEITRSNKRQRSQGHGEGHAPHNSPDASGDTIGARDRVKRERFLSTFDRSVMRHVENAPTTPRLANY